VIYVENDPTLRGMVSTLLKNRSEVELIGSYASSDEALEGEYRSADVALLDLALGPSSLNGTELGLVLREKNSNLGIVIFTQHVVPDFLSSLPTHVQWGWSVLVKRADLDPDVLIDVLKSTARGLNVVDPGIQQVRQHAKPSVIDELTARQREILAIAATGKDANAIAEELQLSPVTVRQDLSKSYAVLVPEPKPGTDLRTSAVLRYLRESRTYSLDANE